MRHLTSAAIVLGVLSPLASAQLFDRPVRTSTFTTSVREIRPFDLDMDGDPDLTWVTSSQWSIAVALQGENGRYGGVSEARFRGEREFTAVDVDGDGDRDLVHADWGELVFSENLGLGGWADPRPMGVQASPSDRLVAADLDHDGDEDVLLAARYGVLRWAENLPGAVFADAGPLVPDPPSVERALHVDLDGDGLEDLVWQDVAPYAIRWSRALGGSAYATSTVLWTSPLWASGSTSTVLHAEDFDADGRIDLALSNYNVGRFEVSINAGNATLMPAVDVATGATWTRFDFGDLDGDGDPDAVLLDGQQARVIAMLNDGDGVSYTATQPRPLLQPVSGVSAPVAVDLDGDGIDEIVVSDRLVRTMRVEAGQLTGFETALAADLDLTEGSSVGDLDGDGVVEIASSWRLAQEAVLSEGAGDADAEVTTIPLPAGMQSRGPALSIDVEGDGDLDTLLPVWRGPSPRGDILVLEQVAGQTQVRSLFPGTPAGSAIARPTRVRTGDANGDGLIDLHCQVIGPDGPASQWLVQSSPGVFEPRPGADFDLFYSSLADLDGDGRDDLVGNRGVPQKDVVMYRRTLPDGSLDIETPVVIPGPALPDETDFGTACDIDGDGIADLLYGTDVGQVLVSRGVGGGAFGPWSVLCESYSKFVSMAVHDLDGDGDLDLAFRGVGVFDLFMQDSTGGFSLSTRRLIPEFWFFEIAPQFADVDGDGDLDILRHTDRGPMLHRGLARIGEGFCLGTLTGPTRPATRASGSALLGTGTFALEGEDLPPGQPGIFLAARQRDLAPAASGYAPLCLAGGVLRLAGPGQVQSADAAGRVTLPLDPTALGAIPGSTLHFQRWTRTPGGGAGFTSGITVRFR